MADLAAWLAEFSLSQYHDVLVENAIDLDVLPELTEADLIEIGMSLGDRRRLLRAARPKAPGFAETAPDFEEGPTASEAERLHLTFMFVDLSGSTALSNELELEEYRDLLHQFQDFCTEIIRAHNGYVAQFIGDAVTAYFGFPRAEEDDAERAVLAGWDMCSKIATLSEKVGRKMDLRVGIATGDVVVDEQLARDGLAMGKTTNMAARLQAVADLNTVAIGEATHDLLGGSFDCEWRGKQNLKGIGEPVGVWVLQGVNEPEMRFQARQRGQTVPFVDREDEMHLLQSRWKAVMNGSKQVVLLSGEAGIGKSRIVEELTKHTQRDNCLRLNFQCAPTQSANAFYPVISLISHQAGILHSDEREEREAKLERFVAEWYPGNEMAFPVFSSLLSISQGADGLPPEVIKEQLHVLAIDYFSRLAAKRPLLLLFEDLHWIDPSTDDLIERFITAFAGQRVLILCTTRPGYRDRWVGLAGVTSLSIARLDAVKSEQLVRDILSDGSVPPEIATMIVEKTDGVPLFVEEMSRMVRERYAEAGNVGEGLLALPETLKDLLRAKIDTMASAREIVPICAAIGRSFAPRMVQSISGHTLDSVRSMLEQLATAQILTVRGGGREPSYTFRHAMIQEAAYELMLPSRARALHKRIAEVIVGRFPDTARADPGALAQHYERAEMPAEARDAWREASVLSSSRSATEETIRHLEAGLVQNALIKDLDERDVQEIRLRKMLNLALDTKAFNSTDVFDNFDKLHALLRKTGETGPDVFLALHVQFGSFLMSEDAEKALDLCKELEAVADQQDNVMMRALHAHNVGMAQFMLGHFAKALAAFDKAMTYREGTTGQQIFQFHTSDIRVVDVAMVAWAHALGETGDAADALDRAAALAADEPHDFSRCFALNIMASACQALGDTERLLGLVDAALAISEPGKFEYWNAWSAILRGWAKAKTGSTGPGIAELQRGIEQYMATGSSQIRSFGRTLLAEAYLCAGEIERGLDQIERVRSAQDKSSVRFHLAMTDRIEAALRAAT